jgi:toxin YoeB
MTYKIAYTRKGEEDLQQHKKSGDKAVQKKIVRLLKELREHPTFGTGKPEMLKYRDVETWSRRINDKHRMEYEINNDVVSITSLWGHYGDK